MPCHRHENEIYIVNVPDQGFRAAKLVIKNILRSTLFGMFLSHDCVPNLTTSPERGVPTRGRSCGKPITSKPAPKIASSSARGRRRGNTSSSDPIGTIRDTIPMPCWRVTRARCTGRIFASIAPREYPGPAPNPYATSWPCVLPPEYERADRDPRSHATDRRRPQARFCWTGLNAQTLTSPSARFTAAFNRSA